MFKLFIKAACELFVVNEADADTAKALADVNKLAVVTCKEVVYELCTNPVPVTSELILVVILAEVCCIFVSILVDKNAVVTAILADIPFDGFQIEDDSDEPDEYNIAVVVATELLYATNSASVAYPLSKLAIAAKL